MPLPKKKIENLRAQIREAKGILLSGFFSAKGRGAPNSAKLFFGQNDFPLRVGGTVGEEAM